MKFHGIGSVLDVENLTVSFFNDKGVVEALCGISYSLKAGEILGIVGESGSGKSTVAHALLGLLPESGCEIGGRAQFQGEDILSYSDAEKRKIRGNKISMIFQNPSTSLNPVYTVGNQVMEAIRCHQRISRRDARKRAEEMLGLSGIDNPKRRMKQYPHQLSGGMRQRVMIAMALICFPEILIADEPTSSLDATIQVQILSLLKNIKQRTGMSILFISHDLGAVLEICDRVLVLHQGRIVEEASVEELFRSPAHPYTRKLLDSVESRGTFYRGGETE